MELEDALATLNVAADCSLRDAELAYASELSQLEEADASPTDLGQRRAELDSAIEFVREALAGKAAEAWTMVVPPVPDIPPEDEATVIMPAVSASPPEDEPTVADAPLPELPGENDATLVMSAVTPGAAEDAQTPAGTPAPELPGEDDATLVMAAVAQDAAEDTATIIGSAPPLAPEDEATLIIPPGSADAPAAGAEVKTTGARKMQLFGALGLALVLLLGIALALLPEDENEVEKAVVEVPVEEPDPVPMLAEKDKVRVLGSKWLNSSDQLARYRQRLSGALDAAPDGLHGELLNQYVIDDQKLEEISGVLQQGFPINADLAEATAAQEQLHSEGVAAKKRLADLEQLNQAMAARNDVMMAITELQGQGVEWPPRPEGAGEIFTGMTADDVADMLQSLATAEENLLSGAFGDSSAAYRGIHQTITSLEVSSRSSTESLDPQLDELLAQGREAIGNQRLTRPAGESATDFLATMKELDPTNAKTLELEAAIKSSFLKLIEARIGRDQLDSASTLARRSRDLLGTSPMLQALENRIRSRRAILAEMRFQPMQPVVEKAGIVMLRVPPGSFDMGSPKGALKDFGNGIERFIGGLFSNDGEMMRADQLNEQPVHRVDVTRDIAISRNEITVGQFERFVKATGYKTDAEKRGSSIAHLAEGDTAVPDKNWRHDFLGEPSPQDAPVIHVSYNDAVAFSRWLSRTARARYRLPTESEFEYAARAGRPGIHPWGEGSPPANFGNFRGSRDKAPAAWGSGKAKPPVRTVSGYSDGAFGPVPAGRYELNDFGLENMLGNVAEWTADCYLAGYSSKKSSQGAREFPGCTDRAVRGSSWASDARKLRASYREGWPADYSSNTIGFRVVREVNIPDS